MDRWTIRDVEWKGKRALTRVDFNVPLQNGEVSDDTRIRASLPTLRYLAGRGARVVLCSHLGRPKGKVEPALSLRPVARRLGELWGAPMEFMTDCIGPEAIRAVERLAEGEVLLLENLRFHPGEEKNEPEFARQLASLGDAYVNDAFGAAHRAHASTVGVTEHLQPAVAGFLLESELLHLSQLLASPRRPFLAILGGAKISGKIEVIQNLLPKVDRLLIGGAMTFTFLRALGLSTGRSLVEEDKIPLAQEILHSTESGKLEFPEDLRVAASGVGSDPGQIVSREKIPADLMGVDIGPETRKRYAEKIEAASTVLWNGPMGIFEVPIYAEGTLSIARALARASERGATTVVGGGDSAAAVRSAGVEDKVTHVSTGGGASLEFLEGKILPGVAALSVRSAGPR